MEILKKHLNLIVNGFTAILVCATVILLFAAAAMLACLYTHQVFNSGTLGWLLAIPGVLLLSWVVGMIENA